MKSPSQKAWSLLTYSTGKLITLIGSSQQSDEEVLEGKTSCEKQNLFPSQPKFNHRRKLKTFKSFTIPLGIKQARPQTNLEVSDIMVILDP